MNIVDLRPGLNVLHPQFGLGDVKVLTEKTAEILFNDGRKTLTDEQVRELKAADPRAKLEGLEKPLRDLIAEVVEATTDKLNLRVERDDLAPQLAPKWVGGKVVLQPHDASLVAKEVEMDIFFHKIVMVRDNLRVLEQKINAHPKLNDAERVELQHYITKSYGSLTTFNALFRDKEKYF
jgi:hypothetical protein